ncbi:hypothetical protein [Enterococcus cecorum]|uniref:hypothetical protein n=1 Tax=Enterococcus cecorum TaxID=44008 RepID=UPI000B29F8EE|nr:hypothetical protein [Enterococcus cecorum]CAI3387220.1 DMT family transporter [Enterococcus cecorum]
MKQNQKQLGILMIILSAFCFAGMNVFVKLAGDLPVMQKSFFRNLVALFVAFYVLKKQRIAFHVPKESRTLLFFRAFLEQWGSYVIFMPLIIWYSPMRQ